ncbi:MAG: toxin [Candidatus Margulisiibacteriota bacterium]|jgi:uncharacterized DUF497 family protein
MEIVWDKAKNAILQEKRNVRFEDVAEKIINNDYLALLEHPVKHGQVYYLISLHDYVHVVPAVINRQEQIVLKTIFPSRKFNKIYGGIKK